MKVEELQKRADELFASVDWSGNWPDQIDGKMVGPYVIGPDSTHPRFESGYYIGSLYRNKAKKPEYDLILKGDSVRVVEIADRA